MPIDGKTLRRSFDSASGLPALQRVSAWAAENHLVLGEIPLENHAVDVRDFISSPRPNVKLLAQTVGGHWGDRESAASVQDGRPVVR